MRLSTAQFSRLGVQAILDQQSKLSHTQLQIASGKNIQEPADDPTGAALVQQLQRGIHSAQQYQRNGNLATARLNLEETTLSSVNDNIQRIRQLTLQANNDSQTDASRASIAAEIRQRLQDVVNQANTQDANGEYIFAGTQSKTRPFVNGGGIVTYQGNDGQRQVRVGQDRLVAEGDTGRAVFVDLPAGNGQFATAADNGNSGTGVIGPGSVTDISQWNSPATSFSYTIQFSAPDQYTVQNAGGATVASGSFSTGDSIAFDGVQVAIKGVPAASDQFTVTQDAQASLFSTVDDIATALETPRGSNAARSQLHNTLGGALSSLDQALGRVSNSRAHVGARLNAIDDQSQIHDDTVLQLKKTRSHIQDVDYASAISQYQRQLAGLQAAQAAYTRVQGLSLFNYLK